MIEFEGGTDYSTAGDVPSANIHLAALEEACSDWEGYGIEGE